MKAGRKKNVVLIADDDMFIRKIIRTGLSGLAEFIEIENGKDVEKNYVNHEPDILFLDVHLPNKSGLDIISKVKDVDPQAYVIMLSSDSSLQNVQDALKLGAKGFLAKPFPREKLVHYFNACPTIKFSDT